MAPRHLAHYFRAPLPNGRRPLIRILPTSASSRHQPWPHPPPGLPPTAVLLYAQPTPPAPAAFSRRPRPRHQPAVESGTRKPLLLRPARRPVTCNYHHVRSPSPACPHALNHTDIAHISRP